MNGAEAAPARRSQPPGLVRQPSSTRGAVRWDFDGRDAPAASRSDRRTGDGDTNASDSAAGASVARAPSHAHSASAREAPGARSPAVLPALSINAPVRAAAAAASDPAHFDMSFFCWFWRLVDALQFVAACGLVPLPLERALVLRHMAAALGWSVFWLPVFFRDASLSASAAQTRADALAMQLDIPPESFLPAAASACALLLGLVAVLVALGAALLRSRLAPLAARTIVVSCAIHFSSAGVLGVFSLAVLAFVRGVDVGLAAAVTALTAVLACVCVFLALAPTAWRMQLGASACDYRREARAFVVVDWLWRLAVAVAAGAAVHQQHAVRAVAILNGATWGRCLALLVLRPFDSPWALAAAALGECARGVHSALLFGLVADAQPSFQQANARAWGAVAVEAFALCLHAGLVAVLAGNALRGAAWRRPARQPRAQPAALVLGEAAAPAAEASTAAEPVAGLGAPAARSKPALRLDLSALPAAMTSAEDAELARKRAKLAAEDGVCSEILPWLFVSSGAVAGDRSLLRQHGITSIINTAPMVVANAFADDSSLEYWSLSLLDTAGQDLMSFVYDVIDQIDATHDEAGRTLVHCAQGVSRSVALAVAYVMHSNDWNYDDALAFVKARRSTAEPNAGFAMQLMHWYDRTHGRLDVPSLFELVTSDVGGQEVLTVPRHVPIDSPKRKGERVVTLSQTGCYIAFWPAFSQPSVPDVAGTLLVWQGAALAPSLAAAIPDAVAILQHYEQAPSTVQMLTAADTAEFARLLRGGIAKGAPGSSSLVVRVTNGA